MTSDFTHEETMHYFDRHQHFGLPKKDFFFFQQGALPCLDPQGKILLAEAHKVE